MDGLGKNFKLVPLCRCICQQIARGGVPRKEQDFTSRKDFTNENHGVDTIHNWHGNITNDEVGLHVLCKFNSFAAGIGGRSIETSLFKNDAQRVGDDMFVIHHQHAGLWLGFQCLSLFEEAASRSV